FGKIKLKHFEKAKKPLSLLLTYLFFFGLIGFFLAILIPQLSENISKLVTNVDSYVNTFKEISSNIVSWINETFHLNLSFLDNFNGFVADIIRSISDIDNIGKVYTAAMNTASFIYNWALALIISVYMLGSKEFLCIQLKRLGAAFLPTKWLPTIYQIINVSDDKCGKFLVGKILDSTIIGLMVFAYMAIRGLPYAPLISVIVGVCNVIPFFGPFIGGIPSAMLLLLVNPAYCIEFVIMIILFQQIDGNIIGPKIVGAQVGLVGFWSLFSVMVAGGLFGISGMILGTPIFAAIYTLIGRKTKSRIEMKGENATRVIEMNVVKSSGLTNMKAKVIKKPKSNISENNDDGENVKEKD
ncbi:MAG: AI-2E family transporter, partial [Ruminococcus sp.]|nr:AI-2E family transporter [Ruminococcus sp.]